LGLSSGVLLLDQGGCHGRFRLHCSKGRLVGQEHGRGSSLRVVIERNGRQVVLLLLLLLQKLLSSLSLGLGLHLLLLLLLGHEHLGGHDRLSLDLGIQKLRRGALTLTLDARKQSRGDLLAAAGAQDSEPRGRGNGRRRAADKSDRAGEVGLEDVGRDRGERGMSRLLLG